jgi:hypothetical protein
MQQSPGTLRAAIFFLISQDDAPVSAQFSKIVPYRMVCLF